jgi:hypothetical protein
MQFRENRVMVKGKKWMNRREGEIVSVKIKCEVFAFTIFLKCPVRVIDSQKIEVAGCDCYSSIK